MFFLFKENKKSFKGVVIMDDPKYLNMCSICDRCYIVKKIHDFFFHRKPEIEEIVKVKNCGECMYRTIWSPGFICIHPWLLESKYIDKEHPDWCPFL